MFFSHLFPVPAKYSPECNQSTYPSTNTPILPFVPSQNILLGFIQPKPAQQPFPVWSFSPGVFQGFIFILIVCSVHDLLKTFLWSLSLPAPNLNWLPRCHSVFDRCLFFDLSIGFWIFGLSCLSVSCIWLHPSKLLLWVLMENNDYSQYITYV